MKSLVVANWKMNPITGVQARALFRALRSAAESVRDVSVVVAPPTLFLRELKSSYKGKRLSFAAQHARAEESGAFTGEVSMAQVKDAGASYLLVGHAERRAMGETNDDTRIKVAAAITNKLIPILCIGESTRDAGGAYLEVIREQILMGLKDSQASLAKVIIAYEPLWAIGHDKAMSSHEMHEMTIFIRKTVFDSYNKNAMAMKILYGGAIDDGSAASMCAEGNVDGLLIGRASVDARVFTRIIKNIHEA